jgi:hypothetical protein
MSLISIRPLGCRDTLVGFDVRWRIPTSETSLDDVRAVWTLWDPLGLPHVAYPEIPITRPMGGREWMEAEQAAWAKRVEMTRKLFGASPISGQARGGRVVRGLLTFQVDIMVDDWRWTLEHRSGLRWHLSPHQLRQGSPHTLAPASRHR